MKLENAVLNRRLQAAVLTVTTIVATVVALGFGAVRAEDLAQGFVNPPPSARAHTWWHWMNGNITREGITADLEAMARVGIGGAQIFNAAEGIPHGPVQFGSTEWRALVKHAATEADRLGLELCIHNCAGWSSSGGPWNTPEHAMQIVVSSEKQVDGPARFEGVLQQPPTKLDCYRDIAVLAFRTPPTESMAMKDFAPKLTVSTGKGDGVRSIDGKPGSAIELGLPTPQKPQFLQIEFARPFTARTLSLTPSGGMRGCYGWLQVSEDGKTFRKVESLNLGRSHEKQVFEFAPVTARFFRVSIVSADAKTKRLAFSNLELSPRLSIENLSGKAFYDRVNISGGPAAAPASPDAVLNRDSVVDLTGKMAADGKLQWDAPAGKWTVVRFGYTPNGRNNHPAPVEGTGLECDKLSAEAAQAHWDGLMGKLTADMGPLTGKTFNNVLIDSYEVGTQNWTPRFRQEFQKRRGYDSVPFLPVLTGRVVDSREVTERFLWDFRRTIADLFAENYSAKFAQMAHRSGMLFSVEPYGDCPTDDLQYGSYADIPMSEFWPGGGSPGNAKHAAALGHVYGRQFVGAESFTAAPEVGKWLKDPFSLKAQGDLVWCAGVNRFIFHRYAHQPWTGPTRFPGMTMGQWGTHFERTVTWWEQSRAWLSYIARSQYLLQRGRFVGDVLFFSGEGAPNDGRAGTPAPGFDYDTCCAEALLKLASVRDGRIVLPSGMSYRVLALTDSGLMTPPLLRKLKELAAGGATIVGRKPVKSPSLAGWPQCDEEVRKLADELWGKTIQDQSPADALASLGVKPDFTDEGKSAHLAWIHRIAEGADIYFVSNQRETSAEASCTFRVAGKQPELWHSDTGVIEEAPVFTERDGQTTVPLRFDPAGSVFVVFRHPVGADHVIALKQTNTTPASTQPPPELKVLKAEYGAFNNVEIECVDVTRIVKTAVKNGKRRIAATTDMAGGDPAPNEVKELRVEYMVAGAHQARTVVENQTLELPAGAEIVRAVFGLVGPEIEPPPNQVIDLTAKLNGLIKDGALVVQAGNELAGRDPAGMIPKELRIEYSYRGARKSLRVGENRTVSLPDDGERPACPSVCDLSVAPNGQPEILAWQPVSVEMTTAGGKTLRAEAKEVAAPVEIAGPWELAFPPNWGAPAKVVLDKLISWTGHPDSGVKYFSGTAIYKKRFDCDLATGNGHSKVFLDLGALKNIAEVKLNGKDLGILWKPPFRVEITGVLRARDNELEVRVTNLWPNRLIGDEQLPEDREWDGIKLKAWPQWLLAGKPSPTGRFTFTTWHHWTKADEPLASGLFGPVLLRSAVVEPAR